MRCKHCGGDLEGEPVAMAGGCTICGDARPGSDTHPNNAVRCDGCGHNRAEMDCKTYRDGETVIGTYCRGCQTIMDDETIQPGEHEQYCLMDAGTDLKADSSSDGGSDE